MAKKSALITGITGQDGSYLAEFLLKKGYDVAGTVRKTSNMAYDNIGHIQDELRLIQADLLDPVSLREAIQKVKPDEVTIWLLNLTPPKVLNSRFTQQKLRQLAPTGYWTPFGI